MISHVRFCLVLFSFLLWFDYISQKKMCFFYFLLTTNDLSRFISIWILLWQRRTSISPKNNFLKSLSKIKISSICRVSAWKQDVEILSQLIHSSLDFLKDFAGVPFSWFPEFVFSRSIFNKTSEGLLTRRKET